MSETAKKPVALRLLRFLMQYWPYLLLGSVASALASGFEASLPVLIGQVIDVLDGKRDMLIFNIFLLGFDNPRLLVVNFLPFWIFVVIAFTGVFAFFRAYMISYTGQRVVLFIRNKLFGHLVQLPMRFYDIRRSGDVVSRVTNDVHVLQESANSLKDILHAVTTLAIVLTIMFLRSWKLTLLIMITFPFLAVIINYLGGKSRIAGQRVQSRIADLTAFLTEILASVKLVKVFRREDFEVGRFMQRNLEAFKAWMYGVKIEAILRPLMEIVSGVGLAVFFWYGCHLVLTGKMTTGLLLEFTGLIVIIYAPIKVIGRVNTLVQKALAAATRVFEMLDEPGESELRTSGDIKKRFDGAVAFNGVSFSYDESKTILADINLDVKPSEVIAMVGPSGAGKSTLVSLISRLYEITEGELLIDGADIKSYDLYDLRGQISIVPQETILFADTVYENIHYGNLEADKEAVHSAARAANAHGFIEEMPDGYDTYIGERGVQISGGQRQRLGIARAIVNDPRILILDEATSSLDTESEKLIQDALENLMMGRTTFIVAHRLSTVRSADRIVVLQNGRIAEVGTHFELVTKEGVYHRLLQSQMRD
ncbi:MAG: ABC transporter ATP-binding protein [bacterium]|nr:ABC transporter ATP-binding protein [bacterium]